MGKLGLVSHKPSCSTPAPNTPGTPERNSLPRNGPLRQQKGNKPLRDRLFYGRSFSLDSTKDCSFVRLISDTCCIFRLEAALSLIQNAEILPKLKAKGTVFCTLTKSSFASVNWAQSKRHVLQCVYHCLHPELVALLHSGSNGPTTAFHAQEVVSNWAAWTSLSGCIWWELLLRAIVSAALGCQMEKILFHSAC